jgi:REP element-mobilizing transposase RayT
VFREAAKKYKAEIIAMEIMPDHVHWLVEVDPQSGIPRFVKYTKGISSRHHLRKEFPSLVSRLPSLWTNRYFVSTLGGARLSVIKQYVEYRLYPNRKQREILSAPLDMCRELYNAALQERMESYKTTRESVTWLQQQSQLPAICPEFKSVHAHTLQAS